MKLTRRSSNGVFYLDLRGPDGRRRRVSLETSDRAEAERRAPLKVTEVSRAAPAGWKPGDGPVTLGVALELTYRRVWSTQAQAHGARLMIDRLSRHHSVPLSEINYAWLSRLVDERLVEGNKAATINRYLALISRAMREAQREGFITAVPRFPRRREANLRERYLSPREQTALMDAVYKRCSADRPLWIYLSGLIPFLLDTGLRLSEALNLGPDEIKTTRVILKHGTTKNGRGRIVPLTPNAMAALILMLAHGQGAVKVHEAANRFRQACSDAKLQGVTLHTLRHTFASRMISAGVGLYHLQKLLGHSNPMMTTRYAHLADEDMESAVRALAQHTAQMAQPNQITAES